MQVPISVGDKTIYLVEDSRCYALARLKKVAKGKSPKGKPYTPFKWYRNLDMAFESVLNMKVKASDARTLEDLKDAIYRARKELTLEWRVK